jgi:hypothetical protein
MVLPLQRDAGVPPAGRYGAFYLVRREKQLWLLIGRWLDLIQVCTLDRLFTSVAALAAWTDQLSEMNNEVRHRISCCIKRLPNVGQGKFELERP